MKSLPKKQQQILRTARTLFWKHGFRRVSIEEICRLAEVSKMTFYKFYPNKTELAKAVYSFEAKIGIDTFRSILHEDSSPEEKIKKLMLVKLEGSHDISPEFINDFYSSNELGLKEYIVEQNNLLLNATLTDFRKAQEKGIFRKDFKPEFLLYLSRKVTEMITDQQLVSLYGSPGELILEVTNFFIYGMSPHD